MYTCKYSDYLTLLVLYMGSTCRAKVFVEVKFCNSHLELEYFETFLFASVTCFHGQNMLPKICKRN